MDSKTDGKAIAEAYAEGIKEGHRELIKLINSQECTIGEAVQALNNIAAAIREHTESITREDVTLEEQQPMYDLAGNPID